VLPVGPLGDVQPLVSRVLLLLGAAFLVANTRLLTQYIRYVRLRRRTLLTWTGPTPPYYGMGLAIGVVLGVLLLYKLFVIRTNAFGEGMMFLYYGYLMPLSRRIGRGFYEDGIWTDSAFIPYEEIGGISWREGPQAVSLAVIARSRNLARRLAVPAQHYAAARRVLRDKIGEHTIQFAGTGLQLDGHDARDDA
jgi:hypothetical protein